ncbi:helix-turn-helix domain-containing protein [Sphingomonas paucimobilis]|uniref:helix-turn-helix domain-containing protein n=1 Tax=Sphingomonas paucimobilis TaxID=13689 RepID=UPI001D131B90|nr:helix-turn-helix transcriptional regulator [Sphingomonas paucimobilis]
MAKGIHDSRYRWMIAKLVQARKEQGLTQEDVARRLGKPQQYVSRYEVGERRLDMVEFLDAASVLGVDGLQVAADGMVSVRE